MEIFRADNWLGFVQMVKPNEILNLASHALTSNDGYDAECAFSPDGKWICFTSNRSGDLDLYAVPLDSGAGVARVEANGILVAQFERDARADVEKAQAVIIARNECPPASLLGNPL